MIEQANGITEKEALARNRAWRQFKFWLNNRTLAQIVAADAEALATLYPPLPAPEIAQVLQIRGDAVRKCEASGRVPVSLI